MVREGVTSDPYYFKYQVTTLFARKHYPIYPAFEAASEAVLTAEAVGSKVILYNSRGAVCLLGQPKEIDEHNK